MMKMKNNITMNQYNGTHSKFSTFRLWMILLFICSSLSGISAQEKIVKGIVRDAHTRMPVNAARISVINDRTSATTDENGQFTIRVNVSGAMLKVSAYEYNTREIGVRGKDNIVIDLYPDVFSSQLIRKTGASGTFDNSLYTNNIDQINNTELSSATSPEQEIQLQLAASARSISRSGATGMGNSLFIRGLNSVNANAQPLYIIDGVIKNNLYDVTSIHGGYYSNPLSYIESGDIESLSVLKDGTSIYGSKAANGVVIIRTKRGSSMATKISLNIVSGMTEAPRTMPVMGAADYKIYITDLLGTAGFTNTEIAKLPYLSDDPARSTYNVYHNDTQWNNEIYRQGISQNYNISVNGGGEKAMYYFSLGYVTNQSNVKNTDYQKYNMRWNADIQLAEKISTGINIGISSVDRNLRDDGVNYSSSPTWLAMVKSPFLSPNTFTYLGEKTTEYAYADLFGFSNPSAILSRSINTVKQNSFNVGLTPEYSISKNLKISDHFDYYLNKSNEDYYRPYLYSAPVFVQGVGDSYNERQSQVIRDNTIFNHLMIKFNKQLDNQQQINIQLGNRYLYEYFESDYVEGHNSMSNSVINLRGSFRNLFTSGVNNLTKSISNYINADYQLQNKYLLNIAASMDASSRFGKETSGGFNLLGVSWGMFPSVNGAWIASSEEFMKNISTISNLKLRAGYGLTGNDDIADYQTKAYFSAIRFKGIANGIILNNPANDGIQWETTRRAHAGLDLGLLNDRINLSIDVFSGLTSDLLVQKNLPEVTGLDYYWKNSGEMSNKGFEISADFKVLNFKNLQWEMNLKTGHYKNQIESLPEGSFITKVADGEVLTSVGNAAGVFYGYKTLGVFADEAAANTANLTMKNMEGNMVPFGAGDIHFEDFSGPNGTPDGVIDGYDKQVIGNPNPDYYGSVFNKITYKNLSLSALVTYSYGNDVYNYSRSLLEAGKDFSNQTPAIAGRWTAEGQTSTQPRAVYLDPMGNARFSDRWIEDGSYLKIKTLSLSYNVPLSSNAIVDGINLWVSANNLLTISNYLGADPEFSAGNSTLYQGVDMGLIPLSRSYFVGVKLNL